VGNDNARSEKIPAAQHQERAQARDVELRQQQARGQQVCDRKRRLIGRDEGPDIRGAAALRMAGRPERSPTTTERWRLEYANPRAAPAQSQAAPAARRTIPLTLSPSPKAPRDAAAHLPLMCHAPEVSGLSEKISNRETKSMSYW
jgi:hypothetical protein